MGDLYLGVRARYRGWVSVSSGNAGRDGSLKDEHAPDVCGGFARAGYRRRALPSRF
ncbi:hypothetical protein PCAR4_1400023 [Paraburkholderia caribensis]|nr:hypothetical protein PCAR4_1400023 [Paraburkholderia caribensis]